MTEENLNLEQEQAVDLDTSNQDEDTELGNKEFSEVSTDEDASALKAKLEEQDKRLKELEEQNKQLYARAKRNAPSKEVKESKPNLDNIEVIEFFSKGNTREDFEQLNVIMKGKNLSLSEAQKDPLFVSYKEKREKELRDEKAQIGGSRASASSNQSAFKPGLTPEEHKEAWKKMMNK